MDNFRYLSNMSWQNTIASNTLGDVSYNSEKKNKMHYIYYKLVFFQYCDIYKRINLVSLENVFSFTNINTKKNYVKSSQNT